MCSSDLPQADARLVRDSDQPVREILAAKIARLLPALAAEQRDDLRDRVVVMLETLARDQASRVRQTVAEALKDVTTAPPALVRTLAQDVDIAVAEPVLRFSPLLSDADLLDIIAASPQTQRLAAIAGRRDLREGVSDALVGTGDSAAVAALLANPSAQIREETLDRVLDQAAEQETWHEPLAARPKLTSRAASRIASFLASALLERFQAREDLPAPTRAAIAEQVEKRLAEGPAAPVAPPKSAAEQAMEEAEAMKQAGKLDDAAVAAALGEGRRLFGKAALAVLSKLPLATVEKILAARSAKAAVALVWKAKLTMAMAMLVQQRMAGIAPRDIVRPKNETDWPMSADELSWNLELFDAG